MSKTPEPDVHPSQQLMDLRGSMYLPVNMRLAWLVRDWKEGKIGRFKIVTNEIEHRIFKDEKRGKENAESRFRAEVTLYDADGNEVAYASSIGTETMLDFRDYSEKAETKSLGRALAMVGYGTQHSAADFEEGEKANPITGEVGPSVADAPVKKKAPAQKASAPAAKPTAKPAEPDDHAPRVSTESVTKDEAAEQARKEEIVKWISAQNADGNTVPLQLMQKATSQYKASTGLDPDTKLKVMDLPLGLLEKVHETAAGLSASA